MIDYNFNGSGLFSFFYFIKHNTARKNDFSLFSFIYVTSGFCRFTWENKSIVAGEGQMLFVPTDINGEMVFYNSQKQDCTGIYLMVRFFAGVNKWDYAPQVINPTEEMINALIEVPKDKDYKTPKKDCGFIRKAYTFLEMVQECMVKNNNRFSELIEKAIEYMFNTPKYSIKDVARYCNISERYLAKIFEQNLGITPVKMKQKIMAEKAEELLKETSLTIDEIANKVGFESTAHFRKVFESRFHITPSTMRKLHKSE